MDFLYPIADECCYHKVDKYHFLKDRIGGLMVSMLALISIDRSSLGRVKLVLIIKP